MNKKPRIYLAAPLFNRREHDFNLAIAVAISPYGEVFLPQRDGELLVELIRCGLDQHLAERRVFEADINAMNLSELLVAILDGGHIDEGVAFEIGYMFAQGKRCVGLQTDVRRALPTGNNPMIGQGLSKIFNGVDPLCGWLADWSADARSALY